MDILLFCLAMNVYFEARSEPLPGQYAVAEVTLRRAAVTSKPVCATVFEDAQFSWTRRADELKVVNQKSWAQAMNVARAVLVKPTNYSKGATHFHADYVRPAWAKGLCMTVKIGRHIFYKECV